MSDDKDTKQEEQEFELPNPEDFQMGEEDDAEEQGAGEGEPFTEEEEKAYNKGWRPLEEFDGDEDDWVDAREFNRRAPIFERLHKKDKKIAEMEKTMNGMKEWFDEQKRFEVEALKAELAEAKKEAYENGRFDEVVQIEERQREVEKESGDAATEQQAGEMSETFMEWASKNKWYEEDLDLQAYANGLGPLVKQQHPTYTEEQFLEEVGNRVKKMFPDKFGKPLPRRGGRPQSRAGQSNSRGSWSDLTAEEKQVGRKLIEMGAVKDQATYAESLAKRKAETAR
jgi:hypothetical protein